MYIHIFLANSYLRSYSPAQVNSSLAKIIPRFLMLELAHCRDIVCYLNHPEVWLSLCFSKYRAKNRFGWGPGVGGGHIAPSKLN